MPKLETWTYGDDLRRWRDERLRISQQDAASKLGMSIAAYGKWERGQVVPSHDSLRLLVERLGVPPEMVGYAAPRGWELVPAAWIQQQHEAVMTELRLIRDHLGII